MNLDECLEALRRQFQAEPYATNFGIELVDLEPGRALVKMETKESMNNVFGMIHGAAIYSLMDAAFELTVNSHGTVAVALSVNVHYQNAVAPRETLLAEGREVNRSARISSCEITVTGKDGRLIASCQALAYRKKDALPFL
jgi:acyl-CoA thioesterase